MVFLEAQPLFLPCACTVMYNIVTHPSLVMSYRRMRKCKQISDIEIYYMDRHIFMNEIQSHSYCIIQIKTDISAYSMATARLECMYLNTSNPASKAWAAVRRHFTLVFPCLLKSTNYLSEHTTPSKYVHTLKTHRKIKTRTQAF